jgi:small-conductance mechanosensitive channel
LFNNFGEYALEFELSCMVANVDESGGVRSDLRFAILKSLRAEGIVIPYPRRDLRWRGDAGPSESSAQEGPGTEPSAIVS